MTRRRDASLNEIWQLRVHIAHPEGGYYAVVFRSVSVVAPADGRGTRPALTTIYFLLPEGALSRWHRVWSDEVWDFQPRRHRSAAAVGRPGVACASQARDDDR